MQHTEKLFIPAPWKRWIAENLILNNSPESIKQILVEKGFPEDLVDIEVDAASAHPFVEAGRGVVENLASKSSF